MPEDEQRLTAWMEQHLRVTWAVHAEPWALEAQVVAELTPPLNQSANSSHPLYRVVRDARSRWRQRALETGTEPDIG